MLPLYRFSDHDVGESDQDNELNNESYVTDTETDLLTASDSENSKFNLDLEPDNSNGESRCEGTVVANNTQCKFTPFSNLALAAIFVWYIRVAGFSKETNKLLLFHSHLDVFLLKLSLAVYIQAACSLHVAVVINIVNQKLGDYFLLRWARWKENDAQRHKARFKVSV